MGRKKRENYLRWSILVVENSKDAIVCLFEFSLNSSNLTFEEFLNKYQHEIYHLCYNKRECCQCNNGKVQYEKGVLNKSQLRELYEEFGEKLPGHASKNGKLFCCRKAVPNLTTNNLDISLCRCFLNYFCNDLFWQSCLNQQHISLKVFLDQNKHVLYHMWKGNNGGDCCYCNNNFNCSPNMIKITIDQWDSIFERDKNNTCVAHKNRKDAICSMSAIEGIETHHLGDTLARAILTECCPLKQRVDQLVDMRNIHAHAKKASMTNESFLEQSNRIEDAITHIAVYCKKEQEMRDKFKESIQRSFDEDLCIMYKARLLEDLDKVFEKQEKVMETATEKIIAQMIDFEHTRKDHEYSRQKQQQRFQEFTRAEVEAHVKEGTFVETNVTSHGLDLLNSEGIVVLTGTAGSGKTRNSLEIMRLFVCTNRDYKMVKFSSLTEWKNNVSIHDKLVILFEDIFGKTNSRFSEDQDSVLLEELYASANHMKINRVIITIRDTVRQSCHTVLEKHRILNEKFILDISSKELQMNETQKFTCLLNYFKITNIEITRNATDENFKEEKVQDNMFKVKFHDETVQKMIKTKTTIGFPQAVYLFTGNRKFTGQGPAFFADAPNCLLNEIKELREKGKKVEQDRWQYVTLVYTMLIGCELRPNDIDNHLVEEIFKSLYKRNLPENFNELIRASATVMSGRYLSCKSGENRSTFTFQHQTTFEAVLVSYGEKEPAVVIPFMSLEFITELVRPFHYKTYPGETVLKIPHKHQDLLAKRLVEIMLTEYSKRKQCFIQIICEAEIIRQTQEEMICVMIDQYESKIKKILSRSKLNMRFFKDPKPETKSTMFNITSVFLQTIISCKENDHVVETLVERISTTLQTEVELEVKNECRKTLIQAFEETCATGTSHRLKIIYQVITANKLESYIDLPMCMKGACKHRNVQCSTWLFEEVKDAQTILRSVMQDSCHENDLTDVEWLLENFEEEDLDLQGSVLLAYKQNHIDIVKYFTENVDDQTHLQLKYILTLSCCDNNSYLAGYLLENVDHQHFDLTFTMKKVCEKGRKDIAKLLMVKVEEKDKLDLIKAINTACQFGWKDLVELLLGEIDRTQFVMTTILETSIKFGRIELAKWLKSRVGDYTPTDKIVIVESGKYFGQKQ